MVKLDCNFWLWALEEIHWFLSVIINHKKIFLNLLFNPVLPRDITDDTFHKQTVHVTHNNHVTDGLTCTWEAMYYGHCITRKSYISTYIFPSPLSIHSVWNSYFWNQNFFFEIEIFLWNYRNLKWLSFGHYWVFTNPKKKQNSIWNTRSNKWTQMIIVQFLQTMIILCSFVTHHCLRLLLIMQPLVSFTFFVLFER